VTAAPVAAHRHDSAVIASDQAACSAVPQVTIRSRAAPAAAPAASSPALSPSPGGRRSRAAAAAAQGRLVLASAPSLAAGYHGETGCEGSVTADLQDVADGLAGLAGVLAAGLSSAARQAADPGDRDACEQAGAEAARVCGLLARDG